MQKDFEANHPEVQVQLLAINEHGHESGNANATNRGDIPFLQDVDKNGDGDSDLWTRWQATWRDVYVANAEGEVVAIYNLTPNDLRNQDNYDELKEIIINASVSVTAPGDCDGDDLIQASDLACVSDIAHRDAVLDELNGLPGDLDGDGIVGFNDFLVLSSNFGSDSPSYVDGNIDLQGGIDFADFLVLADNYGAPTQVAPASKAAVIDAAFADAEEGDDD